MGSIGKVFFSAIIVADSIRLGARLFSGNGLRTRTARALPSSVPAWAFGPHAQTLYRLNWWMMTRKVSVVIELDENGYYAWCPELKGCQTQGKTIEESLANIREAIELFLETLTDEERSTAFSREILTTSVEVHA